MGFLQRLHRIHIQHCLEGQSQSTGICYPHREVHKKKDGHQNSRIQEFLSNDDIYTSVQSALQDAKDSIRALGMDVLLQQHKKYENPPLPVFRGKSATHDDIKDEDEDGSDSDDLDPCLADGTPEDTAVMNTDFSSLRSSGIVHGDMQKHFDDSKSLVLKKMPSISLPLFDVATTATTVNDDHEQAAKLTMVNKNGHSLFVQIQRGEKTVYIRKTTVIWLLQEGEWVPSDRLFRVRAKQPHAFSTTKSTCIMQGKMQGDTFDPTVSQTISVGNVCVFKFSANEWKIGRVLSFAYYLERYKSSQVYTNTTFHFADQSKKPVGVLCTWYVPKHDQNPQKFILADQNTSHQHISVDCYVCTLSHSCMEWTNSSSLVTPTILERSPEDFMLKEKEFTLTSRATSAIHDLLLTTASGSKVNPITVDQNTSSAPGAGSDVWTRCGTITLGKKQKQDLLSGKELCDLHVNAFQNILKSKFPEIKGLQNTLLQRRRPISKTDLATGKVLQIVHIPSHWVACQLFTSEVHLYDSAYTSLSADTLDTLAQLLRTDHSSIMVKIMNVSKQSGSVDCALYAMATLAHLAFGKDPTAVVFD